MYSPYIYIIVVVLVASLEFISLSQPESYVLFFIFLGFWVFTWFGLLPWILSSNID